MRLKLIPDPFCLRPLTRTRCQTLRIDIAIARLRRVILLKRLNRRRTIVNQLAAPIHLRIETMHIKAVVDQILALRNPFSEVFAALAIFIIVVG